MIYIKIDENICISTGDDQPAVTHDYDKYASFMEPISMFTYTGDGLLNSSREFNLDSGSYFIKCLTSCSEFILPASSTRWDFRPSMEFNILGEEYIVAKLYEYEDIENSIFEKTYFEKLCDFTKRFFKSEDQKLLEKYPEYVTKFKRKWKLERLEDTIGDYIIRDVKYKDGKLDRIFVSLGFSEETEREAKIWFVRHCDHQMYLTELLSRDL